MVSIFDVGCVQRFRFVWPYLIKMDDPWEPPYSNLFYQILSFSFSPSIQIMEESDQIPHKSITSRN